jgi:hypothetical protein
LFLCLFLLSASHFSLFFSTHIYLLLFLFFLFCILFCWLPFPSGSQTDTLKLVLYVRCSAQGFRSVTLGLQDRTTRTLSTAVETLINCRTIHFSVTDISTGLSQVQTLLYQEHGGLLSSLTDRLPLSWYPGFPVLRINSHYCNKGEPLDMEAPATKPASYVTVTCPHRQTKVKGKGFPCA